MKNGRCRHPICPEAKAEIASEIFEEIRKIFIHRLSHSSDPIYDIASDLDELEITKSLFQYNVYVSYRDGDSSWVRVGSALSLRRARKMCYDLRGVDPNSISERKLSNILRCEKGVFKDIYVG